MNLKKLIPYSGVTLLACLVFASMIIHDLYKADIGRDHQVYLYSDEFCTPNDYQEDTKGLQKLIDCAGISGKIAVITKGAYLVDSLVIDKKDVAIEGQEESYIYQIGHSRSIFYMYGINCQISGLSVFGNAESSAFYAE